MKKNPIQSMKKSIVKHQDVIVFGGIVTGMVALYAAAVVFAIKQDQAEAVRALNVKKAILDAASRGDIVLPNSDGSWWILPRTTSK